VDVGLLNHVKNLGLQSLFPYLFILITLIILCLLCLVCLIVLNHIFLLILVEHLIHPSLGIIVALILKQQ